MLVLILIVHGRIYSHWDAGRYQRTERAIASLMRCCPALCFIAHQAMQVMRVPPVIHSECERHRRYSQDARQLPRGLRRHRVSARIITIIVIIVIKRM